MKGLVSLIGAGPGDPGLLTVKAARRIAEAEVLIYDALAAEPIVALASEQCERIYVGKRSRRHTMPQEQISALLLEQAGKGRRVVRLKGGDPFIFGRGGEEAQELSAAGIPFEIVPGISSALAVPAYAGIPLTHRSFNTSFTVATGHEDPIKGISTLDWSRLADGHGTLVFLMAMGHLEGIVAELQRFGRPGSTPVAIISEGTTPRQRTVVATLETIVAEVERTGIAAPAVVVVGDVVTVRDEIRWFDRRPLFGQRVLITRPQPEAAELGAPLWELGAEPIYAPTVQRRAPHDAEALAKIVDRLVGDGAAAFRWIILTSRYGVRCLFAELEQRGRDVRALGGIALAAIGPGTAEALKQAGVCADLVAHEAHSEGLAESVIATLGKERASSLLLWTAEGAREHLFQALNAAGHSVTVAWPYATIAAIPEGLVDSAMRATIWTFTSGSAIQGFLMGFSDAAFHASEKTVICIGPTTARVAEAAGFCVAAIAESASVLGLLDAMEHAVRAGSFGRAEAE